MSKYVLTGGVCGCMKIFKYADPSYIPEDGTTDLFSTEYIYYSSENNQYYYVNENGMATALKHSEDTTAPELNGMALFIGLQDNGDGSFTNYNFTPSQLVGYVMAQSIINVTCEAGSHIDLDTAYATRNLALVITGGRACAPDEFDHNDLGVDMTNGLVFSDGQIAILIFNS